MPNIIGSIKHVLGAVPVAVKHAVDKVPVVGKYFDKGYHVGSQFGDWIKKTGKDVLHGHFKAAAKNTGKSVAQTWHHVTTAVGQVGKAVQNGFDDIKSAIAGMVAKCIASFFITKAIIDWLAKHSMAATVFVADPNHLNNDSNLSDIVNNKPFGLIYTTKDGLQTFFNFIASAQGIFNEILFFMLVVAIVMAGMKLNKSAILNAPDARREFIDRVIRIGIVFIILDFYPYIIQIVLQIDGTIVLAFQDLMMQWPIGSGSNATSLWYLCLHMGSTFTGMKDMFSSPGGFAFTLIFWLVNLITGMWVFAYYIWREIAFTIVYLLGYIQVPMFGFGGKMEEHFHRWVHTMFGIIFIQAVHAFVLTIMAMFFSVAQQQVTTSFLVDISKTLKNFGAMLMMGVILTMFQPLSRAIAKQLDIDIEMIDGLNASASSSAATLLPAFVGTEAALVKTAIGAGKLAVGGAELLSGKADKAIVGAMLNKAKANSGKEKKKNPFAFSLFKKMNADEKMQRGKTNLRRGGGKLLGALGDVADSLALAGNASQDAERGKNNKNTLRRLSQTRAGGQLSHKIARHFNLSDSNLRDMGIKPYHDDKYDHDKYDDHKDHKDYGTKNNKPTGNPNNSSVNPKYNSNIDSQVAQNKNAQNVQTMSRNTVPQSAVVQSDELNSMATVMAHTPIARNNGTGGANIPQAMKAAIRESAGGNYADGNVDVHDVMGRFRSKMYRDGYSPSQVDSMITQAGHEPYHLKDGDISRDFSPISNRNYESPFNASTSGNNINHIPTPPSINGNHDIPAPSMPEPNGTSFGNNSFNGNGSSYNAGSNVSPNVGPVVGPQSINRSTGAVNAPLPNFTNPQLTPSYLANNLQTGDNGLVDPNALQVHVTNGASYIKALMNDGSARIVSSLGQGDPTLDPSQEYVHPLQIDTRTNTIRPYGDQGMLYTNGKPMYTSQPNFFASSMMSAYNNHGYASPLDTSVSVNPANPMVDQSAYTMDHLVAENNKYSGYALNGSRDMSYISAYNQETGQRERITPIKAGVAGLDEGVTFEKPITYSPHGFSMSNQTFKFTDQGPAPSGKDFNGVKDWLSGVDFNNYIHPTKRNPANYLMNHEGNLNISQADFYG